MLLSLKASVLKVGASFGGGGGEVHGINWAEEIENAIP